MQADHLLPKSPRPRSPAPIDKGTWIVSFMQYDLGYIDLEQKTLQPSDNPFGTRLSPMS